MVIRERYLKQIRPFYNQELIKVLIGLRRSGKSVLLQQIIDELKKVEKKVFKSLWKGITDEEKKTFYLVIEKMTKNV